MRIWKLNSYAKRKMPDDPDRAEAIWTYNGLVLGCEPILPCRFIAMKRWFGLSAQ